MGWWNAGPDGSSLHFEDTGLLWGDGPADIMDDAVEKIVETFEENVGRKPTQLELLSGLKFATNGMVHYGELEEQ